MTGSGTCAGRSAPGVPGRGENLNAKVEAKPTRRTSASVSSKSRSVSPGKPTMKSDDSAMSGRAARISSTSAR